MAKKQVTNATPNIAAEFTKLFGPPPLLKTEDTQSIAPFWRASRRTRSHAVLSHGFSSVT